ncbi:Fungal Zn2-Cys6 binuclear cluster domain-containing protein isoform 2 [Cladophialophora immunda]|nr:Fungal Zn2-Cys6 binuclear cluster domain-containing protein isoform 2 [Cladophialophora immunda]
MDRTPPQPTPVMSPSCRTKSKTGCRTCKIRKIKCDELMPECRRCTSTGRKCDGYGIWGGGGGGRGRGGDGNNTSQQRHRPQLSRNALAEYSYRADPTLARPRTFCVYPASALDADEKAHLEWFWCRTARKLQGAFFSDAGNALLFQASAAELAVTHAVLALCSVHKRADVSLLRQREERFALVQYNKAIKYLQPRLMASDRTSLRLCLLSCIAFIHLEFFRSHYQTARSHLEHGLRMLDCLEALSSSNSHEGVDGRPNRSFIDDWIVRNLRGLYVQSMLFGQQPPRPWTVVDGSKHILEIATFSSAHQAREYMELLLLRICRLTEPHARQSPTPSDGTCSPPCQPKDVARDLQAWKSIHDRTMAKLRSTMNGLEVFAHRLLCVYHTMAEIMVATTGCDPRGESRFDHQTARFTAIVAQTLDLRHIALTSKVRQKFFGTEEGLSHSIADMGLMAPLFYVAVKCRVHCLRVQAIRLIADVPRKEGIWDATLVAQIARKVMAVEEADIGSSDVSDDDLPGLDVAYAQLQSLPISRVSFPSACRRVEAVDVLLPDGPWDPVVLKCSSQDNSQLDTYLIDRHEVGI